VLPTVAAPGLSAAQAAARLAADGPNRLPPPPRPHPLRLLAAQMLHFFALMLWVAAALAVVAGMPTLAVAIVLVVLVNGAFSFAQEHRADRAAERLRDLMPVRATVRRDGRTQQVDAADLVVGDLVVLDAGDRVSADLTAQPDARVSVNESMLTGESAAVRKGPDDDLLAGTYVVEGAGSGLVRATGPRTRLAGIATVTQSARRPVSPLVHELHRVVRTVAIAAVSVGVTFFVVAAVLGRPLSDSFVLAIGVTVALVPEGLLPTVTLSLARAAQRMAGRRALVRHLEAVETLGATTFICTDKTGTLTLNQMAVVEVVTPAGTVQVLGEGYDPDGSLAGDPDALAAAAEAADTAARCAPDARVTHGDDGGWQPVGDPMLVALRCWPSAPVCPNRPPRCAATPSTRAPAAPPSSTPTACT